MPLVEVSQFSQLEVLEYVKIALILIGGSMKVIGAYTSYIDTIQDSITKVNPYKTMIWLAVLSATTGVFNFMWTIFQLLGGVPSFVLEATMTLVYLLEPCVGFVLAGYGWFVGVPVDRSFWL